MTKEKLFEVINAYVADGEEVALANFWTKADTEGMLDVPLTDDEWLLFVRWWDNWDSSYEISDALAFAIQGRKDEEKDK